MATMLNFPLLYFLLQSVHMLIHGILYTAIIILAYKLFKRRQHLRVSSPVMPGPKVPIYSFFGLLTELPSYSTMKKVSLPITTYMQQISSGVATMFRNEKIIGATVGFKNVILLTKSESVEEFLCRCVLLTKPHTEMLVPFFGNGLFTSTGSRWKSRKKLVTPLFHHDILKEFIPIFDKESKVLVDILKGRHHEQWIDIIEPVALCSMDIICETFLGVNIGAQHDNDSQFVKAVARATQNMVKRTMNPLYRSEIIFGLSELGRQFYKDMRYIRGFAEQVIQQTKEVIELEKGENKACSGISKRRRNNVLCLLLDVCAGNPEFTEIDARDELISFLFGGQDTTSSAMAWALYLIGLYPDVQRKIHEELDAMFADDPHRSVVEDDLKEMNYIERVVKESLRLYPSVPYNVKCAAEDFNLCSYKVNKGSITVIDVYDLHRNPEAFPNPEIFDPDRFLPEKCADRSPYAYVPFSVGVRSCIGRSFAMLEEKAVIANVLRYFSLKSLEPRDKIHTSVEIVLRSPQPLKVKFTPRNNCMNSSEDDSFKRTAQQLDAFVSSP